jgi:hypothetical protein
MEIKGKAISVTGYFELKNHKPWFDEGCTKLIAQRKQAKLQWFTGSKNPDIKIANRRFENVSPFKCLQHN